jgi:cytochrome P450
VTNRTASQDDVINGIKIPKGTIIFIGILPANFDETLWGPDVDTFNPDRWDKLPETITNYAFLTFLQGPRNCIGRRFAETEMKVLMVNLIRNFKFDEVEKGRVVEKRALITTRPTGGMFLKLSAL